MQENKQDMTNSSKYNESLACEAFISGKQSNRKYYVSLSKTYDATPAGSLKIPTLQNRSIYLFCAHITCFLSVCFARQTVRKSIAMNVRKPKGISLKIFKVYVNVER